MKKSYSIAIGAGIAVVVIGIIIFSSSGMSSNSAPYTAKTSIKPTEIQATEIDETYRWESQDSKINPTLTFVANTENVIKVKNTTDEKHEFVIESDGKEFAASGDVTPDGSKQFSFNAPSGTYEYHCEYHPTTMKGTIVVTEK